MTIKIKVCGMGEKSHTQALVSQCLEAGVLLKRLGFILHAPSSRFALNLEGFEPSLIEWVKSKGVQAVAVSVGDSVSEVLAYQKKFQFSSWQLHGEQSVEFISELKQSPLLDSVSIVKALAVSKESTPLSLQKKMAGYNSYNPLVDEWLFDTQTPLYGGSGVFFDWQKIPCEINATFWLGGGLKPALKQDLFNWHQSRIKQHCTLVCGFDLNSGFEVAPAHKQIDKIISFASVFNSF